MKKWFEFQLRHQRTCNYLPGSASHPVANVESDMAGIFDNVMSMYPTSRVTRRTEKVFSKDCNYTNGLAANVSEIDRATLDQWVYDPALHDLLDRPSHEVVYFHELDDRNQLIQSFCKAMGITQYSMKEGLGSIKLHVQHPGHVFALHFDRPQHYEFLYKQDEINHCPSHTRFLVFMENQLPGQVFQMDNDFISWNKGDVFTWDARNTMHGSCNFGYWPRFMIMFTLKLY